MLTPATVTTILGALGILALTLELVRRRHLREKYAALWLVISLAAVVLALFPRVLGWLSNALGFGVPANLLFFVGFLVLLFVSMQLSLETGRREGENERLAEEVALLRHRVAQLENDVQSRAASSDTDAS